MAANDHDKTMARHHSRTSYWAYLDKRIPQLHSQGTAGSDATRQAKAEYGKGWR